MMTRLPTAIRFIGMKTAMVFPMLVKVLLPLSL